MKPKNRGSRRMSQLGKKPSQLWYSEKDYQLVKSAALVDGRPMTQFAIRAIVAEANRVLKAGALSGVFKL